MSGVSRRAAVYVSRYFEFRGRGYKPRPFFLLRGSMACRKPNVMLRQPGRSESGEARWLFVGGALKFFSDKSRSTRVSKENVQLVKCHQCVCCRLERSADMATRLIHQKKFHEVSSFLTLTYDDKHVPSDGSLSRPRIQTFFKDLRARLDYYDLGKLKFVYVGEYGEKKDRPHYHAIVFGGPFRREDCNLEEPSRSGGAQWSSEHIASVWKDGRHRISEVTYESAAYVARYSLKKVTGDLAPSHYGGRTPEFLQVSQGLGREWFEAWKEDTYPQGTVILDDERGEVITPRYYDRLLKKVDPVLYEKTRELRKEKLEKFESVEDYLRNSERRYREGVVKGLRAKACLKREGV